MCSRNCVNFLIWLEIVVKEGENVDGYVKELGFHLHWIVSEVVKQTLFDF